MTQLDAVDARLSTTFQGRFKAGNVIDGDVSTMVASQPAESKDQWISVQLRLPIDTRIGYVEVYNRNDDYWTWLNPYEVWLGRGHGEQDYLCDPACSAGKGASAAT